MRRRLLPLLILASSGACSRQSERASRSDYRTDTVPSRLDTLAPAAHSTRDSLLGQLAVLADGFGQTRAAIRGRLGPPTRLQIVASANPNAAVTDTVIYMDYNDLEFILTKDGTNGRERISNIRATGPAIDLPRSLRINRTSRAEVTQLLGRPDALQMFGDTTVLGFEMPNGYVIQFYMLNELLARIRWVFEVG
jgi:hypothetical protein